ncbi:presumably involved in the processing and regular turnover of intracellular proteins [Arthrobacter sp. Hiyo4]|nr:presumably involved in the processing and regular turnover of intracellular proteins [Arthrobacter sp. Hiyo4]
MVKNTEINLSTLAKDLKRTPSDAVVIGVGQGSDGPSCLRIR